MKKTLLTFKHKKGIFIADDSFGMLILTGIIFLLIYLEQAGEINFGIWTTISAVIWFLSFITYLISRFFLHEIENGVYIGKLILNKNSVIINQTEYNLEEIKNIKIHSSDIKGKFIGYSFEFSRKLSNGLKNEIIMTLKDESIIRTNFLQEKRDRIKYNKDELINYHLKGKFSWLHLLDILEITDYEKIQIFKKELKNEK